MSPSPIIRLSSVDKEYHVGSERIHALRDVSVDLDAGDFVALMGPSGSGKTTLMHVIGGLLSPDSGSVIVAGQELSRLGDGSLSAFRNRTVGFVFQFFNLQPYATALENVALPMLFAGVPRRERRERARQALEEVGLLHRAGHRPSELSGGEMQRVSIARAIVNDPPLLLADEPTGNLDRVSSQLVLELIQRINEERGVTVLLVTHNERVAALAERVLFIDRGEIGCSAQEPI